MVGAVTPKCMTPTARSLGALTPKSMRGPSSAFHMDLEHQTPKSCRNATLTCMTPRTPSTAASRLLSLATASNDQEGVLQEKSHNGTMNPDEPACVEEYPRLLGRHPFSSAAFEAGQRRVRFSDEAQDLAEGARAACLAMRQRITGRRLARHA